MVMAFCMSLFTLVPYLRYGLTAWGQASNSQLNKPQKRTLRFIYFANCRDHAIPLFIDAKILPLNFLHYISTTFGSDA